MEGRKDWLTLVKYDNQSGGLTEWQAIANRGQTLRSILQTDSPADGFAVILGARSLRRAVRSGQ
jgi:hypothetical protein